MPIPSGPSARLRGLLALVIPPLIVLAVHLLDRLAGIPTQAPHESGVLSLERGSLQVDSGLTPPPALRRADTLRLPLHTTAGAGDATWVSLPFTVPQPAADIWSVSLRYRPSLQVFLDGQLLAQSEPLARADHPSTDMHLGSRMLVANIPPLWLPAGNHRLQLRLGSGGAPGVLLDVVTLGPADAVMARGPPPRAGWAVLRFVTAFTALVLGALLLLSWLANRDKRIYLLAGAHVLLLAFLLSPWLFDRQPLPLPWWRLLLDLADVATKALLLATVVLLSRRPSRGWLRFCAAYAVVGALCDGTAAAQSWAWSDFSRVWPWWALGSRAFVLAAAAVLAWREALHRPGVETMLTAILVATSGWLWADVSLFVLVIPGVVDVVDANVLAHAGWVLWVGILLQRHFILATQRERQLRREAADALEQRTNDLQASFAALQASERQRLAASERELILQDMHDGLGSQLLSAKMNAQTGALTSGEMTRLLDGCIDELRQTLDALSVTSGDLGPLLGNMRHRMQRTFDAAGLHLDWQVADTPPVPALAGTGGRELVRIVQEAFTNVLAHARAGRLTVRTAVVDDGSGVLVSITDDGLGLAREAVSGRGMHNIRQRSARLGGRVQWLSPPPEAGPRGGGTRLVLWLPL